MAAREPRAATADGAAFELSGVEAASAPEDGGAGNWFRYTITQGDNVITGLRKGTRTAVTRAAKAIVEDLNERRAGRRGRVHLTSPRSSRATG